MKYNIITKKKKGEIMNISENKLIFIHISFIIFTYLWAAVMPFYMGFLLIFLHKSHELVVKDCYLTKVQKDNNYSGKEEDFFFYLLNNKLHYSFSKKFTQNIHLFIKTTVLMIVLYKMYLYFA